MNSTQIEKAFLKNGRWEVNTLIPECRIKYQGGYCRADFLMITPALYATEIEIKVSRVDWENDRTKTKWSEPLPSFLRHFVYLTPEGLEIPDWISDVAGVWRINAIGVVKVERKPKIISEHKVTPAEFDRLKNEANFYRRFWSARLENIRHA